MEVACLSCINVVYAAWGGFTDQELPVAGYEWCAGRVPYGGDVVGWQRADAHAMHASACWRECVCDCDGEWLIGCCVCIFFFFLLCCVVCVVTLLSFPFLNMQAM